MPIKGAICLSWRFSIAIYSIMDEYPAVMTAIIDIIYTNLTVIDYHQICETLLQHKSAADAKI